LKCIIDDFVSLRNPFCELGIPRVLIEVPHSKLRGTANVRNLFRSLILRQSCEDGARHAFSTMRVIGGVAKGRRLRIGKGLVIRPTSDYLKEVIFDILQGLVRGVRFLDLFAGSGNVGIEALSRGAEEVVFVDSSVLSIRLIQDNLQSVGFQDRATLMRTKALTAIRSLKRRGNQFGVIFMDPPYQSLLAVPTLEALSELDLLEKGGMVIAEHFHKEEVPPNLPWLVRTRQIRHGESTLSFYFTNESLTH